VTIRSFSEGRRVSPPTP